MELREWKEAVAAEAAATLVLIESGEVAPEDAGDVAEQVSEKLRTLAIISLLVDGDSSLFCHNLIRSARQRRWYLDLCQRKPECRDFRYAAGRMEEFWDAMAAGDVETASAIAILSPLEWMPEAEYEEDFCYARIIYGMLSPGPADLPSPQDLLERFKSSSRGSEEARVGLCGAFMLKEQARFDETFEALISRRQVEIADEKKRGLMEDGMVLALRHVFVEGLGLLKLAERLGLSTRDEYPLCPALARRPMRAPLGD